jgi:hypothetical protein
MQEKTYNLYFPAVILQIILFRSIQKTASSTATFPRLMTIVTSLLEGEKAAGWRAMPGMFGLNVTCPAAANAASGIPAARHKKKQREQRFVQEACGVVKVIDFLFRRRLIRFLGLYRISEIASSFSRIRFRPRELQRPRRHSPPLPSLSTGQLVTSISKLAHFDAGICSKKPMRIVLDGCNQRAGLLQ